MAVIDTCWKQALVSKMYTKMFTDVLQHSGATSGAPDGQRLTGGRRCSEESERSNAPHGESEEGRHCSGQQSGQREVDTASTQSVL